MAQATRANILEVVENQERGWFATSTFLLCCLVMLADGFDNQAINYAAPAIIQEWGITRALMTPVFNISIVGWMTGSIVFSMLADRIGRRPSTVLAALVFGTFTLLIPIATDLYELAALRFCAAFGVGGAMPMAIALISDYAKSKNRGLRITLMYLGYTIGSSGGGILAAEIIPQYGWRSVFYIGGIGALVVAAILSVSLPESVRYLVLRKPNDPRILGYARKLRPSANYGPETNFVIEETIKTGVPVKHLFTEGRSAMTWFLWFALGFSFITHFFLSQWMTTLLTEPLGFANAARSQALFQLGAAFAFIFGYLIDKKGVPVMTTVMILGALPVAAVGVVTDMSVALTMAMSLASGILVLGGNIGLNAVSSMIYPTFIRSTATGAAFAVARIGAIIGPMIAGFLIYIETPLDMIFLLGALPMLAAGAACFVLDKSITPEASREMASRSALARH
ncbi:MAG: MFS transporter [Alphaproteobacteria bacterium]|nr:MFS transporter [Alphaproteobacteria bacterium]